MRISLPDTKSLIIAATAIGTGLFFVAASSMENGATLSMPVWLITMLAQVADLFFHELGHAVTGWLFGEPSAPLFIITLHLDRSMEVQLIAIAALAFGCYYLHDKGKDVFHSAIALTIIVVLVAISGYYRIVVLYMGHGGSVIAGGIFLYCAISYSGEKTHNQWVMGFIGSLLIFRNIRFCYLLITDPVTRVDYKTTSIFGIDNDFHRINQIVPSLSIENIATFTICFAVFVFFAAIFLAITQHKQGSSKTSIDQFLDEKRNF